MRVKQLLGLVVLVVLLSSCAMKVTEPNAGGFDPQAFRFQDYEDTDSFDKAIKTMFPVGTEKSYVLHILRDIGGANVESIVETHARRDGTKAWDKVPVENAYRYFYRKPRSLFGWIWTGTVVFDDNDKLKWIRSSVGATSPL
ncbi:MAG: hypothetical protein D8M28_00580 [Proteobacteria bacterium]|nr:hypothetical protein [Pseudomonadota bacterium]